MAATQTLQRTSPVRTELSAPRSVGSSPNLDTHMTPNLSLNRTARRRRWRVVRSRPVSLVR